MRGVHILDQRSFIRCLGLHQRQKRRWQASKNPWVKEKMIPASRTLIGNYDGETSTETAVTPILKDGVDLLVERVGQEPKKN